MTTEMARVACDPRIWVHITEDLRRKLAAGVIAAGDTVSITRLSREWGGLPRDDFQGAARPGV
jgi:hypothetical protein